MLRRLGGLLGAVVLLSASSGCTRNTPGAEATGTSVYVARRIRTLDAARPVVEALAVREGKVLATGTRDEVLAAAGAGARVVDLGEATVVPGLTDSHGHLSALGQWEATVSLLGATSKAEALARVASAPSTSFQGEWLVGQGWDQNDWTEKAFPTRQDLDAKHPDVPVMLARIDGHAAWVNSEALRRAGVTRDTKDPEGGRILRGADGEATGILVDNAMGLVYAVLPSLTEAELAAQLTAALSRAARAGLTGVHDAGMDLRTFRLLQRWDKERKLPLRVYAMADGQSADRETYLREGPYQGERLTLRAVKLVLDGALGSRGAALHQDYSDEPGHRGLLMMTPEEYERRVRSFMAGGFQVCTHAIGDRANTLVLDTLLRAAEATGTRDGRHRVEHAQVMRPEDIDRLGRGGFLASVQPTHATSDMPWAEARVGAERIRGAYAWQRLKASGAVLALGSDFPVERPEVLAGLYAARTRQDARGTPEGGWYADQRLSGEEALEGFTVGAAYASFAEARRGRLQPGMDADFVALSVDPVDAPVAELPGAQVRLTVVGGDEVYRAAEK
ncbi:amidohydrolase [Myxococcus llanfairpwllgwyngyllgogerychwyrndrobwllllantysiliogogogochensis]|uniref:Amidohydrolase n=1 Tax=Myxococcus llanfairpwllgwyngyllgogerychwyrndrobwllllantysiliogogogochensis TaxID=2590453 RepID=A0A540WV37_9BACT|nr:amidohydrolase [Myxococcus llanfairpwllgwyngyllgogerychwyrndrobwllllantysiliogogogochensis]TQF12856.1 amidohydrolase [Myxococcus llanfairpwllgwyngyllgogerychwyrndrobwllllantysiliogogogochensis]